MIRVLFVCLGNICRSPMAEATFAQMVQQSGMANVIEVDSAGCGDWHAGEPAHRGTRQILREQGIEYSGCARQITVEDFHHFDYIITMDEENLRHVLQMKEQYPQSRAKIFRLLDFSEVARKNGFHEVPDPYYVGGFDGVYRLIYAGCAGLLDHIRREQGW
jgi:protein-tyrosine phosphatase